MSHSCMDIMCERNREFMQRNIQLFTYIIKEGKICPATVTQNATFLDIVQNRLVSGSK